MHRARRLSRRAVYCAAVKASLSTLLTLALALTLDASAAPGSDATRFVCAAAGISLDPPKGWKTLAVREIEAPEGGTRLPDGRLLDALKPLAGRPLVEFAKHAEPYANLNPTIQINVRPLGGFTGRPLSEVMSSVVIPLRDQHPDLQLVGPAKPLQVSGLAALQTTTSYTLTVGPRQLAVRSHLLVVPRGALFFVIGMTEPPSGPDAAEREFQAALASIRIDP
jgi:hypothetical protein